MLKMNNGLKSYFWGVALGLLGGFGLSAPSILATEKNKSVRKMEKLDRGLVAVGTNDGVLVSWRLLKDDAPNLAFHLYRDGQKISQKPIKGVSNFLDKAGKGQSIYQLRPLIKGKEAGAISIDTKVWAEGFLEIALNPPKDGVTPDDKAFSYTPNDLSVGDLDGDGAYELIVKWDPTNSKDNSQAGYTGKVIIDAYRLTGEQLWRIDLGPNIRAGAHYTQMLVYDFDEDGKAEIALKTADGTIDGAGAVIGDEKANWVEDGGELEQQDKTGSVILADGRKMAQMQGRILKGPEYLSVFEGLSGKVIDTIAYVPSRDPSGDHPNTEQMRATWGDGYGNRSERYLAGVAYLDGVRASMVFARGYYERTVVAAFDLKGGKITQRFVFDSKAQPSDPKWSGQGNHQLNVADVDNDGKDEIIYGAMAIDDDGKVLWSSGLGHGDALHVGDFDPTRAGLERFGVHENMRMSGNAGSVLLDARTGEVLWTTRAEKDTGRGVAADIDPRFLGAEAWASNSNTLYNIKGEIISDKRPKQMNFRLYWDGDLLSELLDGTEVYKWDWEKGESVPLARFDGTLSNNGTKQTPNLSADLLGDWREEVILRTKDNRALRIYSTPHATAYGLVTLMQDPVYRLSIAWQNVAYNQPPHLGYYLDQTAKKPKRAP